MSTVRLRIYGRVQGVGYRAFLAGIAREQALDGWVRNRSDGTVEALVAGGQRSIDAVIAQCREGPPHAQVSEVRITPATPELNAAPGFRVLPSM